MTAGGVTGQHGTTDSERIGRELLAESALRYLRRNGSEESYAAGDIIIRRGEVGRSLFVLLAGEVEARLAGSDGRHLSLARMGPGATFGELAILRNAPTSADVVAVTPVRVLAYPPEHLPTALAECAPLRNRLLNRLAGSLQATTLSTWKHYQRAETLVSLVRGDGSDMPMIAVSARMRSLRNTLDELAQDDGSVLIVGEIGTGKLLAARRIHERSRRRDAPLIVVNCDQLAPDTAHTLFFGSLLEAGGGEDLTSELGSVHVAHEGTMVLRNLDALPYNEQRMLGTQLVRHTTAGATVFPDVRVLATVRPSASSGCGIISQLRECFDAQVELPSLAERPRDIVPLARELLRRIGHEPGYELSDSAEHAIVSARYQHRNVAELADVVELAASCADGPLIEAEHIFGGVADGVEPTGLDLGRAAAVQRLIHRPWLQLLRGATLAGFAAAIVLCLIPGSSVVARSANAAIWNLWEPLVFASFLLVGALWCTVCPLSTAGRLAQRLVNRGRPHPAWLNSYAAVLSLLGFFTIVAVERIFHMTANPTASAILLLTLVAAAVLFSMLFRRELWCRHLCPLGRLASVLAPAAPLYVAASRSVCASTCTTHECFKGSGPIPGCSVFHHPQQVAEAHLCKLCLDCVKSCPHNTASLYLRLPLLGLLRLPSAAATLQVFAVGIFLLAPILLAAQRGGPLATPAGLIAAGTAAVLVAALLAPRLLAGGAATTDRSLGTRVAFALALLGWGPLIAYQIANVAALNQLQLIAEADSWLQQLIPDGVTAATVLRLTVVLVSGAAAAVVMTGIGSASRRDGSPPRTAFWRTLQLVMVAYLLLSAYLSVS